MWRETGFTAALGVRLPIIAAPMAGGPTTPALVAAAGEAGALGVLGAGYLSPEALRQAIGEVRRQTGTPFGVNLLITQPRTASTEEVRLGLDLVREYADELGVSLRAPGAAAQDLDAQLAAVISERVPFFSFAFGIPPAGALSALREAGTVTCGTATTAAEAVAVAAAGADMVCAQAGEAGGHRGGFLGDPAESSVALTALVPLIRDAVSVPVIAAGGIMDGRGVAAALALGADAAQLGTAFLLCPEAGTSQPYRRALARAAETDTVLTAAFSGRPARGIRNRMTAELAEADVPPYPVMNAITRPLRQAAARQGNADFLSLWAGQGVPLVRDLPAADLIAALERETDAALRRLTD